MSDVLHIRIEKDERRGSRGQTRASRSDKIYVTFPGEAERLVPGATGFTIDSVVDGVDNIVLNLVATAEITWVDPEEAQ